MLTKSLFVLILHPSNIYGFIRMGTDLWQCALVANFIVMPPLWEQAASTMTKYPIQSHYPDTELTSPCLIQIIPISRLDSDKCQFCKSLVLTRPGFLTVNLAHYHFSHRVQSAHEESDIFQRRVCGGCLHLFICQHMSTCFTRLAVHVLFLIVWLSNILVLMSTQVLFPQAAPNCHPQIWRSAQIMWEIL